MLQLKRYGHGNGMAPLRERCGGLWLTAAPSLFEDDGIWGAHDRIVGTLAVSAAIVAIWLRSVRWINVGLGSWLLLAPVALLASPPPAAHRMLVGLLMLSTALVSRMPKAVPPPRCARRLRPALRCHAQRWSV